MPKSSRIKKKAGRPKSYLRHLPKAITALGAIRQPALLGRDWISEHLGVSKTTAWRILLEAGATYYGPFVCVEVEKLRAYFERLRREPYTEPELRRQSRTAATLTEMARYMSHRQTVVAADPCRLTGSLLKTLSKTEGVDLTPERLIIEIQGFEDFLRKFGMIVYALKNNLDEIKQFLDAPSRDT